jgi:hypothetical protein
MSDVLRIWKVTVVACFERLSGNKPEDTVKTRKAYSR